MHVLIVGTTMSGKTTMAKRLVSAARAAGRHVLVYDPIRDPSWGADFTTTNIEQLLDVARKNKNCTIVIDEASTVCGNHDRDAHWLATQARHWGHQTIFIAQRPTQVAKNIRDNCSKLFCFKISPSDAKIYSDEWCAGDISVQAPNLQRGECLYLQRFSTPQKISLFSA